MAKGGCNKIKNKCSDSDFFNNKFFGWKAMQQIHNKIQYLTCNSFSKKPFFLKLKNKYEKIIPFNSYVRIYLPDKPVRIHKYKSV